MVHCFQTFFPFFQKLNLYNEVYRVVSMVTKLFVSVTVLSFLCRELYIVVSFKFFWCWEVDKVYHQTITRQWSMKTNSQTCQPIYPLHKYTFEIKINCSLLELKLLMLYIEKVVDKFVKCNRHYGKITYKKIWFRYWKHFFR